MDFIDKKIHDTTASARLKAIVDKVKTHKYTCFGESLNLFDFFVYGNMNAAAPESSSFRYFWGNSIDLQNHSVLHKTDSSIERISASAASSYLTAILPKGIESISINIEPETETDTNIQEAQKTSKKATNEFRKFLKNNVRGFMNTMSRLVRDFIDYGNCSCCLDLERMDLRHAPFKNTYFWTTSRSENFFYVEEESLLIHEFRTRYPLAFHPGSCKEMTEKDIIHIYTNDPRILQEDATATISNIVQITLDSVDSTILEIRNWDYNPIFIAKNNTIASYYHDIKSMVAPTRAGGSTTSTLRAHVYGRGSGIQSISSIVHANFSLQMYNFGTNLSLIPAIVIQKGIEVNKGLEGSESVVRVFPGAVNTLSEPIGGGTGGGFSELSKPQEVMRNFADNYMMHLKQIETSYNTEIFSIATAPNQTATEVVERQESSSRLFRGMASPFFDELLIPLLEMLYLSFAAPDQELRKRPFEVDIFSFEDEKTREIMIAKMERYIGNLVQLASTGIEIPDLAEKIAEALKETEKAYLHT